MKAGMILYLIVFIFTQQVIAKNGKTEKFKKNQQQLVKMAGFAQALREIPQACRYVTTDMYTAASGANIYMAAESLLTYQTYNVVKASAKEKKLWHKDVQKKEFLKRRNSLLVYKSLLNKQDLLAKSMKTSLSVAKSYALNRFVKQKTDMKFCTSALVGISRQAASNRFCGQQCSKAIDENTQTILRREKNDFKAMVSKQKESSAQHLKSNIRQTFLKSCSKIGCIKALRKSSRTCNVYQNQYFANLVYCDRAQLERIGTGVVNVRYSQEVLNYKKKAAEFLNNWIAHPRGRSIIYGVYAKHLDTTMAAISSINIDIDKQVEETGKMLRKLKVTTTNSELIKNDKQVLKRNLPLSQNITQKCFFQKCMSHKQMWKMRKADYSEVGDSSIIAGSLVNSISEDIFNKNIFDNEILNKLSMLNDLEKSLSTISNSWQSRADRTTSGRQSIPKLTIQAQENSLFSNILTKAVNMLNVGSQESNRQLIDDEPDESRSSDSGYDISSIHKNKKLSIWYIISQRYVKVFSDH